MRRADDENLPQIKKNTKIGGGIAQVQTNQQNEKKTFRSQLHQVDSIIEQYQNQQRQKNLEELEFLNQRQTNGFPIKAEKPAFQSKLKEPSKIEKKVAKNLNALDLELSQSQKMWENCDPQLAQKEYGHSNMIKAGGMIDSLDLNVGYQKFIEKNEDRHPEASFKDYELSEEPEETK